MEGVGRIATIRFVGGSEGLELGGADVSEVEECARAGGVLRLGMVLRRREELVAVEG